MGKEMLYVKILPIAQVHEVVRTILEERYHLENRKLSSSVDSVLHYLKTMKQDLHVLVEHPYVDRHYRDTYYHYFATKNTFYAKNSIRLSFFAAAHKEEDFRNADLFDTIQKSYRGFLVVRPTFPKVIGRSVLDRKAFSDDGFVICNMPFNSTANGIKLDVKGFPHSSQDGEATTCAETTVWSILEYFGNKYAEYAPALPSQVIGVLGRFSFERLLPSQGLRADQIAYALKESGFGVKIYARSKYGADFDRLVRLYVESGIPVVGVLRNAKVAHALSIVGRRAPSEGDLRKLPVTKLASGLRVSEYADLDIGYVFVDDNHAPYRVSTLSEHFKQYNDPDWNDCQLTEIIVPLNKRIYMEAGRARQQAMSLLEGLGAFANSTILIRTFLMSSRSFKHGIGLNPSLDPSPKELIMQTPMPKFVWVTEISDVDLMAQNKAKGLIIMDATEPKRSSVIGAMMEDRYITLDWTTFTKIPVNLPPFTILQGNLQ